MLYTRAKKNNWASSAEYFFIIGLPALYFCILTRRITLACCFSGFFKTDFKTIQPDLFLNPTAHFSWTKLSTNNLLVFFECFLNFSWIHKTFFFLLNMGWSKQINSWRKSGSYCRFATRNRPSFSLNKEKHLKKLLIQV